jgi:hypothetical protein
MANHHFLKLLMPLPASSYPENFVFEAGQTYQFPFNFVVPQQLLPTACTHKFAPSSIWGQEDHLQLPPSMGSVPGLADDLSTQMASVSYHIKAKVSSSGQGKSSPIAQASRPLHIIPASAEEPPLTFDLINNDYTLTKSKSIKKGLFSGKLGRITITAAQPSSLIIPSSDQGSTVAKINLRFDPADKNAQPPRLGVLSTKLRATTFYSVRPHDDLPTQASMTKNYDSNRNVYVVSLPLSSRDISSVLWTRKAAKPAMIRRDSDSGYSTSSSTLSSEDISPEVEHYTASVLVPITLPENKTWIPTFHTCLLSRVYALDLSLSCHSPAAGMPSTTLHLKVPVQVNMKGAMDMAGEERDANEFLTPRLLSVPCEEFIGSSDIRNSGPDLPPGY